METRILGIFFFLIFFIDTIFLYTYKRVNFVVIIANNLMG